MHRRGRIPRPALLVAEYDDFAAQYTALSYMIVSLARVDFCLIFVPFGHCDEPEILRYENSSACPIGSDVRHPGDFAVVRNKAEILGRLQEPENLAAMLRGECDAKPERPQVMGSRP